MRVSEVCRRPLVTCRSDAGVPEVAGLMRARHVGAVVVVDEAGRPLGIVTDRDLVVQVMAPGADANALQAQDVMTGSPHAALDCESVMDAMWRMRAHGVRRLPVVDEAGVAVGMLAADDVAAALAAQLSELMHLPSAQARHEEKARAELS